MLQSLAAGAEPGPGSMPQEMKSHYETINRAVTNAVISLTNNMAMVAELDKLHREAHLYVTSLERVNSRLSQHAEETLMNAENNSSQEKQPPPRRSTVADRVRSRRNVEQAGPSKPAPSKEPAKAKAKGPRIKVPRGGGGRRGGGRGKTALQCENVSESE